MRGWGINNDTQVVAYDAHGGMFAARLWWLLHGIGHPAVAVLDGGLAAWQSQGLLVTMMVTRSGGTIGDKPSLMRTVRVEDVESNLVTQTRVVIDARAADRFRGKNETMDPVGDHIRAPRTASLKII